MRPGSKHLMPVTLTSCNTMEWDQSAGLEYKHDHSVEYNSEFDKLAQPSNQGRLKTKSTMCSCKRSSSNHQRFKLIEDTIQKNVFFHLEDRNIIKWQWRVSLWGVYCKPAWIWSAYHNPRSTWSSCLCYGQHQVYFFLRRIGERSVLHSSAWPFTSCWAPGSSSHSC